jgi:flavin reductase (DIM6/NTAB) family NADH-FMN oxidoreductase RutF
LVFLWSPVGYTLEARPGAAPPPGTAIAEGDRRHHVTKVAPSPLPGDTRACAYLLPADGNGLEEEHGDARANGVASAPAEPEHEPARRPALTLVPNEYAPREQPTEADDLLTLLGELPEGASVVTVDARGRRAGLTIGALVPLQADPPLVAFTIPSSELLAGLIPLAGGCGISILAGGQEWLARHFETSERPIAMWHSLAAEQGSEGAPLFVGALGWLECVLVQTAELGSHTLFVCEVREAEASTDGPALARVRGHYEAF